MSVLNKLGIIAIHSTPFLPLVVRNCIFFTTSKLLCPAHCNTVIVSGIYDKCKRTMAQKSITSFFKITPKKSPETDTEPQQGSSKRLRLESSSGNESESSDTSGNSSPVSRKNKIVKRQRIESSSSDSELPKRSEDREAYVKQRINKPVKTYESPKSKKAKIKAEKTPEANVEKSPGVETSVKVEVETSPKIKVEQAQEVEVEKSPKVKVEKSPKVKLEKLPKVKVEKSPKETSPRTRRNEARNSKLEKVLTEKNDAESDKSLATKAKSNVDVKKEKEDSKDLTDKVPEPEYNPLKNKYHPVDDACWSKGEEVPYLALAKTLAAIEETSARLKMIEILSNYFRSVIALTPADLLPSIYLCLNQLAPAYHSLELGIAETYLMKAVGQCTGRTLAQMKAAAHKCGDLGLVAEQARATQRTMFTPPPLKLRRVFAALKEIAHMTGQASVNKKIAKIQSLYIACRYSEAKYLIRSLEGKLRIGLAEQSVLQALALAAATTPPGPDGVQVLDASKGVPPEEFKKVVEEHALVIKTTYCECPNYEALVPVLLAEGVHALPARCGLTPGTPLKPMLAHPTRGVGEVLHRFENEEFTCEWKYDGERAQIHVWEAKSGDQPAAAIFSRNQENNTSKYPDVIKRLPSLLKESVKSCVLDCEAVAYDTVNKKILPFQVLSTRKRKDAQESEIKVQVCVFLFDLLYLNGRPLVRDALAERRDLLREHFRVVPGEWELATSRDCSSVEEMEQFLEESVRGSCEGLMVKTLRGPRARYDIARRSRNWLKLKKDYLEGAGAGDSLDVVVLGAYLGRGKRAGLYGGFLLACWDPYSEEFQALCKIGTGFSDDDLQTFTDTLRHHVIAGPRNYYRYDGAHECDVWFEARCVWEVRCADLSLSPAHRAAMGLVDADRGISLRFPRFIRVRTDKTPEQATSAQQIADMYLAQDQVRNQAPATRQLDDDFY